MTATHSSHGSDCWGRLNDVDDVTPMLTILAGFPEGFRDARRAMIAALGLSPTSRVLEAGCGPGTALPDLLEWIGSQGEIAGIDPTRALVSLAAERARAAGAHQAHYAVQDIRHIESAADRFDAAFCDKILVHVGPASQAVSELARVTRPGGRVGVVEWYSQGMVVASADYAMTRRIMDGSAAGAAFNPMVPLELEQLLTDAALYDVRATAIVAESHAYGAGLQMILTRRVTQAVESGAISQIDGTAWLAELSQRAADGHFYWAALVRWAVGTKR